MERVWNGSIAKAYRYIAIHISGGKENIKLLLNIFILLENICMKILNHILY